MFSESKMTNQQKIAWKFFILYCYQILDSIFLSTCFLAVSTGFVFLFFELTGRPHWSELMHPPLMIFSHFFLYL